jgi:hypothetical protein
MYESMNGGNNFAAVSGNIGQVWAIAYGSRDAGTARPDVAYVGTVNGMYTRGPAGGAFNQLPAYFAAGAGVPRSIALDPQNYRKLYVLDFNNRIWGSFDAGQTWVEVTGDIANLTVQGTPLTRNLTSIAIVSPDTDVAHTIVLVAGFGGVAASPFPGIAGTVPHWSLLGTGLPTVLVTDVHWDSKFNRVIIGTWGRGAWTLNNPNMPPPPPAAPAGGGAAPELAVATTGVPSGDPSLALQGAAGSGPASPLPSRIVAPVAGPALPAPVPVRPPVVPDREFIPRRRWGAPFLGWAVAGLLAVLCIQPARADQVLIDFENTPNLPAGPSTWKPNTPENVLKVPDVTDIRGGAVLGNPTFLASFPAHGSAPNVYGTAFWATKLSSTLTFDFNPRATVTEVMGTLFNGLNDPTSYEVSAFKGAEPIDVQTLNNVQINTNPIGFATWDVNGDGITKLTVTTQGRASYDFFIDNVRVTYTLQPVPEPGSRLLAIAGALALMARPWSRAKRNPSEANDVGRRRDMRFRTC